MNLTKITAHAGVIICAAMFSLCASPAQSEETLYDALGGKVSITKLIDDFVGFVAADPRINFQFGKADIPHLKVQLVDMLCAGTGGPCKYTGRDMKSTHAGMGITNAQFNALAEDLYLAFDKNGVPYRLQNKVIAMLAPMQREIVTK